MKCGEEFDVHTKKQHHGYINFFFVGVKQGVITEVFSSSFLKTILSGIPIGSMANCLAPSGRNDMPHFQGSGRGWTNSFRGRKSSSAFGHVWSI